MRSYRKAYSNLNMSSRPILRIIVGIMPGYIPLRYICDNPWYILVICDYFTKVTRAVPLKDISALDVLSAFLDTWVAS